MEDNLYSLEQKRYERKVEKKKNRLPLLLLIFIFSLAVVFLLLQYDRTELILARYGQVVDGFKTEALIIRSEEVFTSPVSGSVSLKQEEGERISYGQEVLQVDQSLLYNNRAGIVSYAFDGLERRLSPERLEALTIQEIDRLTRDYRQLVEGKYLRSDQPAFRMVDNNSLYLLVKTSAREVKRYRNQELIFIRPLDIKRELLEGEIVRLHSADKNGLIVVELKQFVREWLNVRRVEVEFIKNIYQGITIPRKAVFTCPEGEGVLLSGTGGSFFFKEVKVMEGNDQLVVVEGLKIGDCIVENPAAVGYRKGVE